jgi:hypothetical protein
LSQTSPEELIGNSGGASRSSCALSHYGLESLLDAAVPSGGPPHAAQTKGCLRTSGQEAYWYDSGASATIDSYGFQGTSGPLTSRPCGASLCAWQTVTRVRA